MTIGSWFAENDHIYYFDSMTARRFYLDVCGVMATFHRVLKRATVTLLFPPKVVTELLLYNHATSIENFRQRSGAENRTFAGRELQRQPENFVGGLFLALAGEKRTFGDLLAVGDLLMLKDDLLSVGVRLAT